jgi:mycoredoxin
MDATEPVTMYSTTWCGYCRRLKRQMDEAGIPYREIDLDEDPSDADRIVRATGGFRTVPTLDVGGRLLVNPTLPEVQEALAS